jgi:hypothetical protein
MIRSWEDFDTLEGLLRGVVLNVTYEDCFDSDKYHVAATALPSILWFWRIYALNLTYKSHHLEVLFRAFLRDDLDNF